ncbi:dienelactone hydrolase family protein [Fundidesulfovibrio soli]|uniref:dienelactone hydrolase family protein n=1 Tax=Fundidesulfovibrio soli TaxID=2922716 RepID=UPI001FB04ADF|nr:dienelactone hydrolase family protein [Fundidesulfovibrio soli]
MLRVIVLLCVLAVAPVWSAHGGEGSGLGGQAVDFASAGQDHQQVRGYLSLPPGEGPFPAVVLLHGCSGTGKYLGLWKDYFLRAGYACLVVDSFRPRGFTEICTDFKRVTDAMRVADAYGALEYLAAHPRLRGGSVLVAGFSHGAGIALDAVSTVGLSGRAPGSPAFTAAVSIFPACDQKKRMEAKYRAPALILIGEADDWTPARFCRELVDARTAGEAPVALKVYPGAHHGFTTPYLPHTYRPDVLNKHSPTGKGATLAGSPEATADAQERILEFLVGLAAAKAP